jgi:hypothetical protein
MITLMWREHSTHGWILEGEFQTVDSIIDYLQHSVNSVWESQSFLRRFLGLTRKEIL